MQVKMRKVAELKPYEKNPRKNEAAVQYVSESIREFGFKVPIVIDKQGIIVAGHTRLLAAKKLGLKEVPCIVADDLNPEQIKAYRLADNKTGEAAQWDDFMLEMELDALAPDFDMAMFGFEPVKEAEIPKEPPVEEVLRPYDKHHVLISCPAALSPRVMAVVNELQGVEGVEVENAYN